MNLHGRNSGTHISLSVCSSDLPTPIGLKLSGYDQSDVYLQVWQQNGGIFKCSTVQCIGVVGMARIGFWRGGNGTTSVLARQEERKQDFGVPGMSRDSPGTV